MKKQTAVEWLQEPLENILTHEQQMQVIGLFQQAKAMEKAQIIDFTRKAVRKIFDEDRQTPFNLELYYEETYEE
jgi:hypothetical protein